MLRGDWAFLRTPRGNERLIHRLPNRSCRFSVKNWKKWRIGKNAITCVLWGSRRVVNLGTQLLLWKKFISEELGIANPTKGWLIESAHRLGPRLSHEDGNRSRTLIARFMCSGDGDKILRAAREKGVLCWSGKRVMVFPDFSRGTQAKREAFKNCKKALHERRVKFALQYPATLRIDTADRPKRFDNQKKAMDFIRGSLG